MAIRLDVTRHLPFPKTWNVKRRNPWKGEGEGVLELRINESAEDLFDTDKSIAICILVTTASLIQCPGSFDSHPRFTL